MAAAVKAHAQAARRSERGRALSRIASDVDLPWGIALWVLGAHALTLLSPLLLIWVANHHATYIAKHTARPTLIVIGAAVMMVGSGVCFAM